MGFEPGQQVRSKSDSSRIGVVKGPGPLHGGIQFYQVFWGGAAGSQTVAEQDLIAFIESPKPTTCLVNGQVLGYDEFQRVITYRRLHREYPLRNNIFAFNASRTRFYPYQFKPLVKLLDSRGHRLLVCDEVGLGKTIEAGLILMELRARQDLRTVLVVCPAGLREKWKLEMRKRFGEDFRILSTGDLKGVLDEYEEAPDRVSLNGIVSYESARHASILDRLEDMLPSLDLVIADEAHHMRNFGVRTRRAGVALLANAGAALLLTATPVQLGNENLFSLLNLLDEEDFADLEVARARFAQNEPLVLAQRLIAKLPPMAAQAYAELEKAQKSPWLAQDPGLPQVLASVAELARDDLDAASRRHLQLSLQRDLAELNLLGHIFTRTRKRDVQTDVARRRAQALEITLSPREREFYDAVTSFVRARASGTTKLPIVLQWQLNNIQRRASSSIHAMVHLFKRDPGIADLGTEDDEPVDEGIEASAGHQATKDAITTLAGLVGRWPENEPDSKYDKLHGLLAHLATERADFKVIVFAFFRETLAYLHGRLTKAGMRPVLLHGNIAAEDRPGVIERFRSDPEIHVLLSSRVGSEGLDFQFCDTLVNYDLPWNPMEVEQRIGRLDRIGQQSDVIRIVNLWTLDTIEERILRRLYERIGVFERSIGALDAVLGEEIRRLELAAISRELTAAEAEDEASRVASVVARNAEDMERLESEAERFIGADEYFREEVAAIQSRRRYVTSEQLRRFIMDFIRVHAPGTRLRYDRGTQRGTLAPDAALVRFLKSQKVVGELIPFLTAGPDGVAFTFDSQVAFDEPYIEFINVLHPLVTAIVSSYERAVGERISAQHVALRTQLLPRGTYVFIVYRQSVHAAKSRHTMECVILDDKLQLACDGDDAEAMLGEMVEAGEDVRGGALTLDPAIAETAVQRAEGLFLARQTSLRQRLEMENDAFVERRMASLEQTYSKNIGRVQTRLDKAVAGRKQQRYLTMLRGQLARMEGERNTKLAALEQLRAIQIGHEEITAGILEVLGG